jgi:hypothetical protein
MHWRKATSANVVVSRRYVITAACCLCHAFDWLQFVAEQCEDGSKCEANITDLTPDFQQCLHAEE